MRVAGASVARPQVVGSIDTHAILRVEIEEGGSWFRQRPAGAARRLYQRTTTVREQTLNSRQRGE